MNSMRYTVTLARTFFSNVADMIVGMWDAIYSVAEDEDADEMRVI